MEVYQFSYGNEVIKYEVQRKEVKNINLMVKPDLKVIVSVNDEVPIDYIKDFVNDKAPWIIKQQSYFKKAQTENLISKEYVSGETFKYLGKQYRLKVIQSYDYEGVKLFQGYFCLHIKDKNNISKKQRLLENWLKTKAQEIFEESLNKIYPLIEKYEVIKPSINIRKMKSRWGSCLTKKRTILFNLDLIIAPKYCIDYVVLHELIHFIHKGHNKEFYNLLTVLMPDWNKRKAILDEEVIRDL